MTVSPPLSASLNVVGNLMVEARDPWWIIASAAVALHGADPGHVADVDVLLSITDAQRILPTIGIQLRQGSEHAAFRSTIFGTWSGATPLPVEFMADFHRQSGETWLPVCRRRGNASRLLAWLSSFPRRRTYRPCSPLSGDRRTYSAPRTSRLWRRGFPISRSFWDSDQLPKKGSVQAEGEMTL